MRVLLVLNRDAGDASAEREREVGDILTALGQVATLAPRPETYADELNEAAGSADLVVVAGGDGSLSWAVNALAAQLDRLTLALIPMGTGNDLARTLEIPLDPGEAARALIDAPVRELDLGLVTGADQERLFVNACLGGFPVEVDEALDKRTKDLLGPLAFWLAGLKAIPSLEPTDVAVNGALVRDCIVVGIGNGRSAGGGFTLWPQASVDDGLLDVCALAIDDLAAAAALLARVRRGTHERDNGVLYQQTAAVNVVAGGTVAFNVDGELIGLETPLQFALGPKLRCLVPTKGAR